MDDRDGANRLLATDGVSRRRSLRFLLLVSATVSGLVLLFLAWLLLGRRGDNGENRFVPGVLADYVPEDSAAVLAVNFCQLRETPIGQQHLWPLMQQFSGQVERRLPWLKLVGLNPLDDFDTLLISFALNGGGEPILLARSRLDRSRLQVGPDQLQESTLDHFRIWEYSEPGAKQTTLIAPAGDMLIVSDTRSRVQAALKQASDPQSIHVRDAMLRQPLANVDRRQSLWLAASTKSLGNVSEIDNYLLKMLLRPLLAHAESVYGGMECAEDVRAELHFTAATDKEAAQLEADLKSICEAAPGIALLGRKNELLPLLQLLAAAQIHREGETILLRNRLTADLLEK